MENVQSQSAHYWRKDAKVHGKVLMFHFLEWKSWLMWMMYTDSTTNCVSNALMEMQSIQDRPFSMTITESLSLQNVIQI